MIHYIPLIQSQIYIEVEIYLRKVGLSNSPDMNCREYILYFYINKKNIYIIKKINNNQYNSCSIIKEKLLQKLLITI